MLLFLFSSLAMYFSFRYWHAIIFSLSHVAKNVKKLYGSFVQPLVPFKIFIVSMHGFVQFYVNEYKTEKMEIKIHWTRVNIELHAWVQHFLSWAIKMVDQWKGYHLGNKYRTYHSSFWYLEGSCMRNFLKRLTSSGVMANCCCSKTQWHFR